MTTDYKTHWKATITQARLMELLSYDGSTGLFTWRSNRRCVRAGSRAGTVNAHGYVAIKIDGRLYAAHRMAWLWATGSHAEHEVDHINRVRTDNRLSNLRAATSSQNKVNKGLGKANRTGIRGVSYCPDRGKFLAQIAHRGKTKNLGRFDSATDAGAAYVAAATALHGTFNPVAEGV